MTITDDVSSFTDHISQRKASALTYATEALMCLIADESKAAFCTFSLNDCSASLGGNYGIQTLRSRAATGNGA